MPRNLLLFIVLLLIGPHSVSATGYTFDYNSECSRAYQYYMELHVADGNAAIRREVIAHPYNLMATYLSDYDDCLTLLMNGNPADYQQRKDHMGERLDLLAEGDKSSPWYRLCRAGIYLHWALISTRFGENFHAATYFRKSFILVKDNQQQFPDFEYNRIFLGMEKAVVGAIPDDYKWLAAVFGMRGSVKGGMNMLEQFVNTHNDGQPLYDEARIYYCYLKFYLLYKQEEVWNFLNSDAFPTGDNLLNVFIKANIAINYRKADAAIATLQKVSKERDYDRYPSFDLEMGAALLRKLDPSCIDYLKRFLKNYHGGIFIKDTWQKMAEMYYLQGDIEQATYCRNQINKQGNSQVDADKHAARFAEGTTWPNKTLLKASLLIDGGYYKHALEILKAADPADIRSTRDKLEYNFRLGRAYDELGEKDKALHYYQATINMGRDRKEYYAARAALQMGFVYEHAGNTKNAVEKYKECLSMKGHDYQSSIDEQAKAGINRLTVK